MTTEQIVLVAEKVIVSYRPGHRYGHVCVSVACIAAQRVCWLLDGPLPCKGGRYYTDLKAMCQMDKRGGAPYGLAIEYRPTGAIDVCTAEQMHMTLKRIHRQLDRMSESAGPATTFGHYVTRFAEVIQADSLLVECEAHRWTDVWGFGKEYRQVRDFITEEVNGLCKEVRTALGPNREDAA